MTYPLWLQIAAGISTAEIVMLVMKGIKNRICERDTDYYSSIPLDKLQEYQAQNTREIIKIGGFGFILIIVYIIAYTWFINSI